MRHSAFSRSALVLPALATLALVSGCHFTLGQHRVVKKTPSGGEIALEGRRDDAQKSADAYMASVCPSGYDIVEEGETVVGQNTTQSTEAQRNLFGRPRTQTQSSSTNQTEWRIHYTCKGAATSSPAADGSAPAKTSRGEVHELVVRF